MKNVIMVTMIVAVLAAVGCAKVVGPYYLAQEEYEEGIKVLGEKFRENPNDASSAYYLGRYYLGLNKPKQGLDYLEKAVALEPDNAEYVFWSGVAWWALLDFKKEKEAYLRVLALEPDHISANLYLGHGYLDNGNWAEALAQYDKVVKLDKYNPEALYDRALALNRLGRTAEEIAAWKKFLEYYPDGSMAMQATERLNLHGDFTYRNFIMGQRNVTLKSLTFKPGKNELDTGSRESLHVISAMLKVNKKLGLHIVAYAKGDAAKARDRARIVRDYMLSGNPEINMKRLPLSWVGSAEKVEMGDKVFAIDDSVQFITIVQ